MEDFSHTDPPQIDRPRLYVAHPWSSLDDNGKNAITGLMAEVRQVSRELEFEMYVSSNGQPPGSRRGENARELWRELRSQMHRCHALIIFRSVASEGSTIELINACSAGIPVVMLAQKGYPRHELSWSPMMVCLEEISYSSPGGAISALRSFLTSNANSLRQQAYLIDRARAAATKCNDVGATIKLHRKRLGWSIDYLARRAVLTTHLVAAIESEAVMVNPPINLLARIAYALEISLEQLFRRPEDWLSYEMNLLITQAAEEEDLKISELKRFIASRYSIQPPRDQPPSLEDTRAEIRRWLEREGS